jgi:hypothetical protein
MSLTHIRSRPIVGSVTGTGEKIVVVEQNQDDTIVQIDVNGGTATVEYTLENVMYDAAALKAVNLSHSQETDRYVDPASATWTAVTVTAGIGTITGPIFAVRINVTVAGTPSVQYHIAQG